MRLKLLLNACLHACAILTVSSFAPAQRTIRVDATGAGGAFTRIQPAINSAQPGDTISVKAGS